MGNFPKFYAFKYTLKSIDSAVYLLINNNSSWGYIDEAEKAALQRKLNAHQYNLT